MQPYFFPYIGYFQLIAHSDVFVFHDDVQYIKEGWLNRNRILDSKGNAVWITLPVEAASHKLSINNRTYLRRENAGRILRKIENAYFSAPQFGEVFPLIHKMMEFAEPNVASFNINLVETVSAHLGLRTRFVRSSGIPGLAGLTGQARVVEICKRLGAARYVNPIGGTALYKAEAFRDSGLALSFLETAIEPRPGSFPYLSIIHTLLTESDTAIPGLIGRYRIIPAPSM